MSNFQYQNPGPYPYQPQPKKKKWPIVLAILIPVAFIVGAIIFAVIVARGSFGIISENKGRPVLPGTDYIGVLHVEGTISPTYVDGYDHDWVMDEVERLMEDSSNIGLLLFIDSPGGTIYETDELYLSIEEYKEETGRPVYAYSGSMMASGGYYLAAAAQHIIANRNCWTGSIGVTAGTAIDISDFLEDHNIHATTIQSGKNKTMGGYFSEFTPEQQAIYQSLVDEAYDQFVDVVAKGRQMETGDVKALADGRIYTAKQALSNGLIDGVGTMEDIKEKIEADFGFEPEYAELEYEYSYSIYDYFRVAAQSVKAQGTELGLALGLKEKFSIEPSYRFESFR